jgi:predicted enzyme related to lactoylglutathione lyase
MTVRDVQIGFISSDTALVHFYAEVFGLERLPSADSATGTVHRLRLAGAVLKVMVPNRTPKPTDPVNPFFATTGLRYVTLSVDDFSDVIERATARGATFTFGPIEIGPETRLAIFQDPDGNTVEVFEANG